MTTSVPTVTLNTATGTFLSPDPLGYRDSSNLYSFCGGDPVNRRDPTGADAIDDKVLEYTAWYNMQMDAFAGEKQRLDAAYKAAFRRGDPDAMQILNEQDLLSVRSQQFGGFPGSVETYLRYEVHVRGNTRALKMSPEQLYLAAAEDEAVAKVGLAAAGVAMGYRGRLAPAPRQPAKPNNTPKVNMVKPRPSTPKPPPPPPPPPVGTKVRIQKQYMHLEKSKTLDATRGYMRTMEDAQKVIDAVHQGRARVISTNAVEHEMIVEVKEVTGVFRGKSGTIVEDTNIFMVKGKDYASVVPVNPRRGQP